MTLQELLEQLDMDKRFMTDHTKFKQAMRRRTYELICLDEFSDRIEMNTVEVDDNKEQIILTNYKEVPK